MARPSPPPLLTQIRSPGSTSEQIVTLRALKNELIGHQQKKEMWLGLGILDPIVRIATAHKTHSRQNGKERQDSAPLLKALSEEEMLRLQALCVISSLARGGPAFVAPLHAASALPALLSNLCPSNNASQLVLAALRGISNLLESISLTSIPHTLSSSLVADSLFSQPHITSLCKIFSLSSPEATVQISIAASLVSKLCRDEHHQSNLANAGVLDALATRLAAVVVSQGMVIPGADLLAHKADLLEHFPQPAPESADLPNILEAISVIIADSKLRASQLIYSNSILAVLPSSSLTEPPAARPTKAAWNSFSTADSSTRQPRLNAIEYLIPYVPSNQAKSASAVASAFPPLGTPGSFEHLVQLNRSKAPAWSQSRSLDLEGAFNETASIDADEPESPLIAYLIWLARSASCLQRLMAVSVLTVLYRAGLTNKSRETSLGLLIVPLLVQLLNDGPKPVTLDTATRYISWKIKERSAAVLAALIVDSEYLQKTAFDAGVINKLAKLIKFAYEPVPEDSEPRTWSPTSLDAVHDGSSAPPQSSRLGQSGHSPLLVHKIKVRESTLRAIAALVPFKDEYRKALIDQGVVPYVVESLKSSPTKPSPKSTDKTEKNGRSEPEERSVMPGYGVNPVSVLIAACGAVRHLSRSVSILRTTLIDNGVVMPVFDLLQHSDIDVQIAATAAVCNLVMDFSPMRETISEAGVLKILCEHAHSGNVKLRLNALWALKHLVQSAGNDVKKTCLAELGQDWLIQLICDDTEDEAISSTRPGTKLMNKDADEDVQMDQFEDEEEEMRMTDSIGALGQSNRISSNPVGSTGIGAAQTANHRLAALRELETNPARRARKDDVAVQEQGLDFIRNLIGGFNNAGASETSEMIDFLFSALGQDQIFEILASKLRSRVISPFSKRIASSNSETKVMPPQAEIIAAVEYILVHMAASVPRHRQLVISQTELLKLLIPQFSHPSKEVRLALCWLVINLTWVDDTHDSQACAQRAQELKKLGFLSKLEALEQDPELDIRERAKTAVWQMKQG